MSSKSINSNFASSEENIYNEGRSGKLGGRLTPNDSKICIENVDVYFINNLNNEFVNLGLESILSPIDKSNSNYNVLFNNMLEVIRRFSRQSSVYDRLQEEVYKLDKENESLLKRQQELKDRMESGGRELANMNEKYRQLQAKANALNKTTKDSSDENKKLQNTIEQRDKQFKHDRKKLEKEIEKLKERVQSLSTGKPKELPNLDLSDAIYKGTNGPRGTWNSDGSKKQLDLYSELIKDYDRKMKELIVENNDVKTFLAHVLTSLSSLTFQSQDKHSSRVLDEGSLAETEDDPDQVSTVANEITRLSFDLIHAKVNKEFQSKIDLLKERLSQVSPNQSALHNLTMSSIGSSTLTKISKSDDLTNTTFTVEPNASQADQEHKLKVQLKRLNSELGECKKTIESQSEFINSFNSSKNISKNISSILSVSSSSSISSSSSSMSSSPKNSNQISHGEKAYGKEMNSASDERAKLNMEKKLFYEQKLKFEQDAVLLQKISAELNKQRKSFQDEQESFFQSKLFSSFIDQSTINNSNFKK